MAFPDVVRRTVAVVVRLESTMWTYYTLVITLLLTALGLLQVATYPHLPVVAPINAEASKPARGVSDRR